MNYLKIATLALFVIHFAFNPHLAFALGGKKSAPKKVYKIARQSETQADQDERNQERKSPTSESSAGSNREDMCPSSSTGSESPVGEAPTRLVHDLEDVDRKDRAQCCTDINEQDLLQRLAQNVGETISRNKEEFRRISIELLNQKQPRNFMAKSFYEYLNSVKRSPKFNWFNSKGKVHILRELSIGLNYEKRQPNLMKDCPVLKNKSLKDMSTLITFSNCFINRGDVDFLYPTEDHLQIKRSMFNSYRDLMTSHFRRGSFASSTQNYLDFVQKKYPSQSELVQTLSHSAGNLEGLTGALEVLKLKQAGTAPLESAHFNHIYNSLKATMQGVHDLLGYVFDHYPHDIELQRRLNNILNDMKRIQAEIEDHPCIVGEQIEYYR